MAMNYYEAYNGETIEVVSAKDTFVGHGHRILHFTVALTDKNDNRIERDFSAKTDNMPAYDKAIELEGNERVKALFDIVHDDIMDAITDQSNLLNY